MDSIKNFFGKIDKVLTIRILTAFVCIVSLAFAIFSTVQTVQYKSEYDTYMESYETYNEKWAGRESEYNSILSFGLNNVREDAENNKAKADEIKPDMQKYLILSCVLYFVALLMLISFSATFPSVLGKFKRKNSNKEKNKKKSESKKLKKPNKSDKSDNDESLSSDSINDIISQFDNSDQ